MDMQCIFACQSSLVTLHTRIALPFWRCTGHKVRTREKISVYLTLNGPDPRLTSSELPV